MVVPFFNSVPPPRPSHLLESKVGHGMVPAILNQGHGVVRALNKKGKNQGSVHFSMFGISDTGL